MAIRKAVVLGLLAAMGVMGGMTGASGMRSARAGYVIDSLDGDITTNELNSFYTTASAASIPTNNYSNAMADHNGGVHCEGIRKLYEATQDMRLLNLYIKHADVFLSHRNDQQLGEHRVMWDGRIDPIWPSVAPTDTYPGYAACESGQVAGHIAYCAYLILKRPSIWNQAVPDNNPNGFGITYKQRAVTYIKLVDGCLHDYFTKWFLNSKTLTWNNPTDPRWNANTGGSTCRAINRQMMFVLPYQFSAQSHDILGDNPSFLHTYKQVVNVFANIFTTNILYTANGHTVYTWDYYPQPDTHLENIGHAQHDVVGLWQSWESGYTAIPKSQLQIYADTIQYVINLGTTDSWGDNVDGTGGPDASLKTDFIFFAEINRPLYKMIAQSNIDAGQVTGGSENMKNTGYILYMKHWMFTHP